MSVFRFGTIRSPPRRPTVQSSEQSPFCTSPSQLQEVTLDPNMNATVPFAVGLRSPGRTSPIRGRTMKEYEEQLGHLQKENFNLKLRIYFLEERMDHMNGSDDKEKIIKENIELKVKLETSRKELADKQELVCQAAKAVQLMEEQHQTKLKQLEHDYEEQKNSFERHIHELEWQMQKLVEQRQEQKFVKLVDTCDATPEGLIPEQAQEENKYIDNLLAQKHQLECNLQDETEHANHLEVELQEAHREKQLTSKLCENLKSEIEERDCKLRDLIGELESKDNNIAGLRQKIKSLEETSNSREEDIKVHAREVAEFGGIIDIKTNQIKEQHKVLTDLQFSIDEKQREIDVLRSSVMTRDSTIKSLEAKYTASKASARNMELKLDAYQRDVQRLQEEINFLKTQPKCGNPRSKVNASGDNAVPSSYKNKWCYCVDNRSSLKKSESCEDNEFVKIRLGELQEMQSKFKIDEEIESKLSAKLEITERKLKEGNEHILELENHLKNASQNLKDIQSKYRQAEEKMSKLDYCYKNACQTIQESLRRSKELIKENEQLKEINKKRQVQIEQMTTKVTEAYSEARFKQTMETEEYSMPAGLGLEHGAQDVLPCCAAVPEKICCIPEPGDNFSAEVEMMTQFLLKAIKEKTEMIELYEAKLLAATKEMKIKDARVMKAEEEICELRNCVLVLQSPLTKEVRENSQESNRRIGNEVSDFVNTIESKMHNMLLSEVQEKNQEIERLNGELRKRTTNLQELVNKELWDKNREIEKLQDRLNIMCERKDLQIRTVNKQLAAKDLQLKTLQDKVVEFLTKAGVPGALIFKELQSVIITQTLSRQSEGSTTSGTIKDSSKHLHVLSTGCVDGNTTLQCNLLATMEENKYLSQKVDELQERIRNTPERDTESRVVQNLRAECSRLKEEVDVEEKRSRDAREGIGILTRRLEELALFLSSLLQNRELLRGLSIQRHRVLKEAVENSIELSRRFSVSFASLQPGNENTNLMQMSSLSDAMCVSTNSLSLLEFLREKIGQDDSNINVGDILPVNNSCESNVQCSFISPSTESAKVDLGDEPQNSDIKELSTCNDLIKFTPPVARGQENCDEASLSSMTFYNSSHSIKKSVVEGSGVNNDNGTCLSNTTRPLSEEQLSQEARSIVLQDTRSAPHKSFSPLFENVSKDVTLLDKTSKASTICNRDDANEKVSASFRKGISASMNLNLSDSEAWSEPDRNVSMERIGLQEEHGKAVYATAATALRARNSRLQNSGNSSETSEDTAKEDLRMPVIRRARYESGEMKRLQNKLCALEQLNEALKNELNILHLLKDQLHSAKDISVNFSQATDAQECKKLTKVESLKSNETSITIPVCLFEQIRNQREKLESSLLHNDLIRKQLETVILSLPVSEVDDAHSLWQNLKETSEDLDLSQNKIHELETQLKTVRDQLEESQSRLKFFETSSKTLQATECNASALEKQLCIFQATVQEKDNEILERQCLILELENRSKEQSIENEKKMHFDKFLREELETKLVTSEKLVEKHKKQICDLEQKIRDCELKAVEGELKKEELRNDMEEKKTKLEQEICESGKRQKEAEVQLLELGVKLQGAETKLTDIMCQLKACNETNRTKENELDKVNRRIKEIELAASSKISELEKQLVEKDWVYKTELERKASEIEKLKSLDEQLQKRVKELEVRECVLQQERDQKLTVFEEKYKVNESCLRDKLKQLEQSSKEKENELHQQLDEAAVATSGLTLERTKLINEKLRLEQDVRRLELRLTDAERNSRETEKQFKTANSLLEEKVKKLEEEKNTLQKFVHELESANAELEKNLAKINERDQHTALTINSGHVPGMQDKCVTHKLELLSPSSLSSGFDIFTGDGGSLPTSLWSLPSKFFDGTKERTSNIGLQQPALVRQYSDISDCMSEELISEEYKGTVHRASRQLSAPCDRQLGDAINYSADSFETRNSASSPDLGIESDQGRFSSLETAHIQTRPLIQLETTQYVESRDGKLENVSALVLTSRSECNDLMQLKQENTELKRRLVQTRKTLERTVEQLINANQRKKQVEKAICMQLHKTHTILKQSRINLQSDVMVGSCTEECE